MSSRQPRRVLVVAAHPDDEVLGCGGVMARHAAAGDEVRVLILAEGITSRDERRDREMRLREIEFLRRQARRAHAVLGVSSCEFYDFPDNRMDSVPLLDVVKVVEEVLCRYPAELVYTHHGGDLNVDHRIVHQAVITACRPLPGQSVTTVLAFEVPSSTEWNSEPQQRFCANHYQDISAFLERKKEALAAYEEELRAWPHPRSLEAVESQARKNGSEAGLAAAERFVVVRWIS